MNETEIAVLMFGLLLVLLASGLWIGFALGVAGVVVFWLIGWDPNLVGYYFYTNTNSFILSCLPLFILMGELFMRGGLSEGLFQGLAAWFGRFPGGLLHANIAFSAIFSCMSGSSVATAATIGEVSYKEERDRGYPQEMITGSLLGGGALGNLIPPGNATILYGWLAQQSIGQLFLACIIPGAIAAGAFMLYIFIRAVAQPKLFPEGERRSIREKIVSLRTMFLPIITILLVLGGIYAGLTTPTEAAALGAFLAFVTVALKRRLTWSLLKEAGLSTLTTTAMIMLILGMAAVVSSVVAYIELPNVLVSFITEAAIPPLAVLVILYVMYLILGMFLDPGSMMVLTLPVVLPLLTAFGYNLVWFGVILVIFTELAMITPPVGFTLFVIKKIAPDVPMSVIIRGSLPIVLMILGVIWLLTFYPNLCLIIPNAMIGK